MTSPIRPVDDDQIRAAHIVQLIDQEHPGWLELAWNVAIAEETTNSTTQIAEIPVDSRDQGQVEAARERVGRLKGGKKPQLVELTVQTTTKKDRWGSRIKTWK